jgi:aminodeoxyfutalosine deaminase
LVIHTADVVIPISAPPIGRGAVLVIDGRIVDVGPLTEVAARHPGAEVIEWPGIITPGLVNAHTHLQYTGFDVVGAVRYPDYVAWAVRFVAEYETRPDEDWVEAARSGVEGSLEAGVTCIADVVTDWEARDVLADEGLAGVAYLELIGTDLDQWQGHYRDRLIESLRTAPVTESFRVGISPHAPYSVDEAVIRALVDTAAALDVRLHVHVGEVDTEEELYRTGTGAWAERVRQVARRRLTLADRGGTGMGTAEFVGSLGLLDSRCHFAHGVYLDRAGRAMLKAAGTVVALCPRSNLTVGLDPPPVADYLREEVPFAVGTDSLGSSTSLDPLEDVALLRNLATEGGYDGDDLDSRLLRAATIEGARAMGLDHLLGTIEIGKRADLAVFDLDVDVDHAEEALVTSGAGRCSATIISGVEQPHSRSR